MRTRFAFHTAFMNPPRIGWMVDGELIHSPFAYPHDSDWIRQFKNTFPERAKKMDDYSAAQGWHTDIASDNWMDVVLEWIETHGQRVN